MTPTRVRVTTRKCNFNLESICTRRAIEVHHVLSDTHGAVFQMLVLEPKRSSCHACHLWIRLYAGPIFQSGIDPVPYQCRDGRAHAMLRGRLAVWNGGPAVSRRRHETFEKRHIERELAATQTLAAEIDILNLWPKLAMVANENRVLHRGQQAREVMTSCFKPGSLPSSRISKPNAKLL